MLISVDSRDLRRQANIAGVNKCIVESQIESKLLNAVQSPEHVKVVAA